MILVKRAIVLSGGGARGSYQIGVWRALRRLHIKYDIVTGTSVGSLNGALMVQKSFLRAIWFWYNLNFKHIFKDEIASDYRTKEGKRAIYKKYVKAIISDNGMDVSKLEENINRVIDERKLRRSKIDFGLITFNLSNLKPVKLTKEDIPVGKLKDYLMASATCFPAFKKKHIDNADYIDGGYYDNLPLNLAIQMGANEIIAIDLRTIGFKRHVRNHDIKVTYIAPRNDLGSFLVFHKDLARRGMRLGYNDTMKAFDKLDGNRYTFRLNHLTDNFQRYGDLYFQLLDNLFHKKANSIVAQLLKMTTYKGKMQAKDLNKTIEFLGKTFDMDDSRIYNINIFNQQLLHRLDDIPLLDKSLIEQKIKKNDLKGLVNSKVIIKYIYDKLEDHKYTGSKKELSSIALLFSLELLGALYLYVVRYQL
jgi:NTE family protein